MGCYIRPMRMILLAILWVPWAAAHPSAATLGEAHWRTSGLEVALRVPTHDLVAALARRGDDLFGAGGEAAVARYLAVSFQVTSLEGPVALRFLGLESGPTESTLFFEVLLVDGAGVVVQHRLFFELSPNQINTLVVHSAGPSRSLVFHAGEAARPLLPPPPPPWSPSGDTGPGGKGSRP